MGAVLAAQMAADSLTVGAKGGLPTSEWLAAPLVIVFIAVTGLRFAFDLPAEYDANWIFRMATDEPNPSAVAIARRFLAWAVLPSEILIVGMVTARQFGWAVACEHTAMLAVLTLVLIEAVLPGFQKIPFTCRTQWESRRLMLKILGLVFGVLVGAPAVAGLERWILERPSRLSVMGMLAAAAWYVLWRRGQGEQNVVVFEDRSAAAFDLLDLR